MILFVMIPCFEANNTYDNMLKLYSIQSHFYANYSTGL